MCPWGFAALLAGILALPGCDRACDYANPRCDRGKACLFGGKREPRCLPYVESSFEIEAPFLPGQAYTCAQGGRSSLGGSHNWQSDGYALDLAPIGDGEITVVAPIDGEAWVFDRCTDERASGPDAKNTSPCGLGYGNHVKIWNANEGYILLFAHLARVTAHAGPVKRGDVLGITGVSGRAGARHVHFAVTSPSSDPRPALETEGWQGDRPVRYRFRANAAVVAAPDELPCSQDPALRTVFTR